MKSDKTEKQVRKFLADRYRQMGASAKHDGPALAAFLGVELAPERPALPAWTEEETSINAKGQVSTRSTIVSLGMYPKPLPDEWFPDVVANRAALVEIHRRWLAAKRKLDKLSEIESRGWTVADCDWRVAGEEALRALRGETP